MKSKLAGKNALITGGSIGIGYGIAEAMLHQGMQVVITGRNEEKLKSASNKLQKYRIR
ncbi:MAG: SDR family NAD(P)-dependent oxidoreductase [Saprospiraceae bacterium]|nr:SDR family NAD(P)-dependent oxidoreductase [Saprospiraceae bacterium]